MYRPHISRRQFFLHTVGLAFAWGIYFCGLFTVWISPKDIYEGVSIILLIEIGVILLATISWMKYHLFLHKKKGPRNSITAAKWDYKEDWLGYKTSMNRAFIKKAKIITIDCDHEKKIKYYAVPKKDPK